MFTFVLMRIIAVILLVAANAFFAAGEYALVSIRDTRLEQFIAAGRIGARTIRKLHNKLDEVLNGIQIGVTMASLALGWIGEESMARLLEVPLARLPHSALYAHALATIFAFTSHHLHARHPRARSSPSPSRCKRPSRWRWPSPGRSMSLSPSSVLSPAPWLPLRAGCCTRSDGATFARAACTRPKSSSSVSPPLTATG